MSSRRRRADLDFVLRHRTRKRKRTARTHRRRRTGLIAAVVAFAVVVMLALGLGAGVALTAGCDLNSLRPVEIGQNSFVYARDGSLLGSIPADRNREPVSLVRDVAVAAEGDGRDRGPPLLAARRRRLRRHRARRVGRRHRRQGGAGRLDDHAAARAQPLHRRREDVPAQAEGGVPRDQASRTMAEAEDPRRVPEHRLLRQPRVRRRGGGADVLLEAREPADARCRPRCSRACRRRRPTTTRCTTRRTRSPGATKCSPPS